MCWCKHKWIDRNKINIEYNLKHFLKRIAIIIRRHFGGFKSVNPEVTANGVTINVVVDKILNGLYNEHIHYTC